jgi:RNA polymerase sigma-70 factor (ECF subfamily)
MFRDRPHDELAILAEAASRGSERAVRSFVVAIVPQLLRAVRRVLGARHLEVEDATQEALLGLMNALPSYRGEASITHFASRIAVLTAMNVRRREAAAKRPRSVDTYSAEEWPADATAADDLLDARRAMCAVRELLGTLPETQAEALALHCVLGLSITEISECTGVPLETVRSRLRLARRAGRATGGGGRRLGLS